MHKYANLVELEKCCQTHIFLQTFVLIQPRTSPVKFPRSRGLPGWFRGVSFGSESEEAGRLEPSPRLLKLSSFLAESSAFFADFVADISQYAILLNSQKSQKFVNIWLREVRPMKIPSRRACPVSQRKMIVSMKNSLRREVQLALQHFTTIYTCSGRKDNFPNFTNCVNSCIDLGMFALILAYSKGKCKKKTSLDMFFSVHVHAPTWTEHSTT